MYFEVYKTIHEGFEFLFLEVDIKWNYWHSSLYV